MAKLFLDNDTITISEKLTVYGSSGSNDKLIINDGALGSTVNANVETLQFVGKFTDYTFAIAGNQLQIGYQGSVLATVGIQDDSNGTQLTFSDVTTAVNITGMNQATIGKAVLATSLTSYTNAQLDGAPPVNSSDKAPWTLVMGAKSTWLSMYTDKSFISDGTAAGSNLTDAPSGYYPYGLSSNAGYQASADKNQAYWSSNGIWSISSTSATPTQIANTGTISATSYALANGYTFFSTGVATDGTATHTFTLDLSGGTILQVDPTTNTIWHTMTTAPYGTELYKTVLSDTGFNTSMVKDINPGSASGLGRTYYDGVPSTVLADGKIVFGAYNGTEGYKTYVSDGTEAGTIVLSDYSYESSSNFYKLFNGKAVYSVYVNNQSLGVLGQELAFSDGTTAGTNVLDIYAGSSSSNPTILGTINDKLYFTATDANGLGLFSTDGTTFTKLVAISDSNAQILGYTANKAYFAIADTTHGQELWAANLTTGTIALTKDILAGSGGALAGINSYDASSKPTMIGDKVLFNAYISGTNQGLFVSDGTESGTVQLASSLPTDKAIIGNKVFFANSAGVSVADVSAATVSATQLKNSVAASGDVLQSDSDQAFFLGTDEKLYVSTGTDAIELASNVDKFKVVADNAIYLIATNSSNVASLWYSDGTASGTRYIEDLTMSADSYDLANAVAIHTVGILSAPMPMPSGVGVD